MSEILKYPSDIHDSKKNYPFIKFSFVKYYHQNLVIDTSRFSANLRERDRFTNTDEGFASNFITSTLNAVDRAATLGKGVYTGNSKKKYLGIDIILPLPGDISASWNPNWEMADTRFLSVLTSSENLVDGAENFLGFLGSTLFEKLQQQTAARVQNPRKQALFNQIDARTFNFGWVFSPQSEREANTVHKIVKAFSKYSLPKKTLNESQYEFPAEFEISFHNIEGAPILSKTVCTGVSTNLNPSALQLLASGHPVQTSLSLTFMETELRTQDSPGI